MRLLQLGLRVGLALTASVLVPACGGAEQPAASLPPASESPPASVPSTAATPSATPVTGPTPGRFDGATQAEAEQFVRDWWAAVNASLSGERDPTGLRAFFMRDCEVCVKIQQDVTAARSRGRVEGGLQQVVSIAAENGNGPSTLIRSAIRPLPGRLLDEKGKVVAEYEGGPVADFVFNLARVDKSWMIGDVLAFGPRA